MFDPLKHLGKHFKGFTLVFLLGIFLRIAAQMNPLTQMIHGRQVVFPLGVQHLQHNGLFKMTHHLAARQVFLGQVRLDDLFLDTLAQGFFV